MATGIKFKLTWHFYRGIELNNKINTVNAVKQYTYNILGTTMRKKLELPENVEGDTRLNQKTICVSVVTR